MCGDTEIEKHKFQRYKSPLSLEDIDIDNALVSNKIFLSGEKNYKHFIGNLNDDYKAKLSHIMLSKTSPYVKSYDG